ncbi:uncharacterized protein BROUX77_007859 [Berkeleyomyces rouxiae]|uniref:uncharacterized protein n=1 Tax=Berkeleyomyces rouxiae TaxID=2035830 RepID=UPI003B765F4F
MDTESPSIPASAMPAESPLKSTPTAPSAWLVDCQDHVLGQHKSSSPFSEIAKSITAPASPSNAEFPVCSPLTSNNTRTKHAPEISKIASGPSTPPSTPTQAQALTQATSPKPPLPVINLAKTENTWRIILKVPYSSSAKPTKRPRTALPDSHQQKTSAKRRRVELDSKTDDMARNAPRAAKDASNTTKRASSTSASVKSTATKAPEPKPTNGKTKTTKSSDTTKSMARPTTEKPATSKGPKPRTTEYLDLDEVSQAAPDNGTPHPDTAKLNMLMNALRKKKKIVVVAGAGISVSAGIPDFRSGHGLFKTLKSEHKLKASGKQLFDASVYKDNDMTESFHAMVQKLSTMAAEAQPTPFHHMLASLAEQGRLLRLYTQNIDCIDTRLEPLASNVPLNEKGPWPTTIQLHGSVRHMTCSKCGFLGELQSDLFVGPIPPECAQCQEQEAVRMNFARKRSQGVGKLRPRIVLYNEGNPDEDAIGAVSMADLRARPDAVIVVGTTMKIPGLKRLVRELCAVTRDRRDGFTAWINLDPEPQTVEFRGCWDLVVKAKCDNVATLLSLPRWDEYRAWAASGMPATENTDEGAGALRNSKLKVVSGGIAQKQDKATAKAKADPKSRSKAKAKIEHAKDGELSCKASGTSAADLAGATAVGTSEESTCGRSGFPTLGPATTCIPNHEHVQQEAPQGQSQQQDAMLEQEQPEEVDAGEGLIVRRLEGVKLDPYTEGAIETGTATRDAASVNGTPCGCSRSEDNDASIAPYTNTATGHVPSKISPSPSTGSSINTSSSFTNDTPGQPGTCTCTCTSEPDNIACAHSAPRSMTSAFLQPQPRRKAKTTTKVSVASSQEKVLISEEPAAACMLESAVASPSEFVFASEAQSLECFSSSSASSFSSSTLAPTTSAPSSSAAKKQRSTTRKQTQLAFSSIKASAAAALPSAKNNSHCDPDPDHDSNSNSSPGPLCNSEASSSSVPSRRRSIKPRAAKTKAAAAAAASSQSSSKARPGPEVRSKTSTLTSFVTKSSALGRKALPSSRPPRPITITPPPSSSSQHTTASSPLLSAILPPKTAEVTYTPESPASLCDVISSPVPDFARLPDSDSAPSLGLSSDCDARDFQS